MTTQLLLQRLLEEAGTGADSGYVLALSTPELEDLPESMSVAGRQYSIRRIDTELALRRELKRSGGAPLVALIPVELAGRLPPDLLRRSRQGRVFQLNELDVLVARLGVQVSGVDDPQLVQLAIEHVDLLREHLNARGDTLPTVVDASLLDDLLLEATLGIRLHGASAVTVLAALLRGEDVLESHLAALLQRQLPTRFGSEGRLLAWAIAGDGRLEALVVHGMLLETNAPDPPPAVWGLLGEARGDEAVGLPQNVLRTLAAELACQVLPALGDHASHLVREAERIGRHVLPPSQLATSSVLPLGLDNRCSEIAHRAATGEAISAAEIESLRQHMAYPRFRREVAVLEELARLSRYLATTQAGASAGLGEQVRDYQLQGAFSDVTAARLRRALAATDRFHTEAETLFAIWRERRNADNLAFARRLADDYKAAINDPSVVPLFRVWQRHIVPRMTESARGAFVVVLDGCSYPLFLELLEELEQDEQSPLGLPVESMKQEAAGLPGLAVLPSVTSHSRGALMLGDIPSGPLAPEAEFKQSGAATDPARLNQNQRLGGRSRRLFLKGDLEGDGVAELTAALRSDEPEVVVAVFNAVDDIISSGAVGVPLQLSVTAIKGLLPALRAACEPAPELPGQPRRDIMVVADHGHTLYSGKSLRVGSGPTPRYCEIDPGESPPGGFIAIDLEGLGPAQEHLAFAWRMGAYLGQQPQVGFHGGCGLEEMVIPMAWLVPKGVAADEPLWWYGGHEPRSAADRQARAKRETSKGEESVVEGPARTVPAGAEQVAQVQGALPHVPPPLDPAALGLSADELKALSSRERDALALLAQNGTVTQSDLASALSMRAGRVNGFMNQLDHRLQDLGRECFQAQRLPTGEMQYEFLPGVGDE